jgi:hypothetical protein
MCAAKSDVRFTPNSDRKSGLPSKIMSALPPKADMCSALAYVGFGPIADITLFKDLVGGDHEALRDGDAERLSRLDVDEDFKLGGSLYW